MKLSNNKIKTKYLNNYNYLKIYLYSENKII